MLSDALAVFPSDQMIGNPFGSFEDGFTPWDTCEIFPGIPQSPKPVGSISGSDEPNSSDQNPANSNSSSDGPNRLVSDVDERKQRRMISNRDSARRSRMRKQRHLENLRDQANLLRTENRELTNRLRYVLYNCHSLRTDNDRLRSEHSILRRKLSHMRQILMFRQLQQVQQFNASAWPCNNMITTEPTASLIAPLN